MPTPPSASGRAGIPAGSGSSDGRAASVSVPGKAAPVESGLREYLVFLLGLVPTVIAMMRIVLMAQGDTATLYTLLRTLDIPALVIGTYARFIGVLGVGLTLPLLLRGLPRNGQAGPIRLGPVGWTVLSIVFVCSVVCVYPEQILDTTVGNAWPVDIARSAGWGVLIYALAWFSLKRRGRNPRGFLHRSSPYTRAPTSDQSSSSPAARRMTPAPCCGPTATGRSPATSSRRTRPRSRS